MVRTCPVVTRAFNVLSHAFFREGLRRRLIRVFVGRLVLLVEKPVQHCVDHQRDQYASQKVLQQHDRGRVIDLKPKSHRSQLLDSEKTDQYGRAMSAQSTGSELRRFDTPNAIRQNSSARRLHRLGRIALESNSRR